MKKGRFALAPCAALLTGPPPGPGRPRWRREEGRVELSFSFAQPISLENGAALRLEAGMEAREEVLKYVRQTGRLVVK